MSQSAGLQHMLLQINKQLVRRQGFRDHDRSPSRHSQVLHRSPAAREEERKGKLLDGTVTSCCVSPLMGN
jgi:hypothetical protein